MLPLHSLIMRIEVAALLATLVLPFACTFEGCAKDRVPRSTTPPVPNKPERKGPAWFGADGRRVEVDEVATGKGVPTPNAIAKWVDGGSGWTVEPGDQGTAILKYKHTQVSTFRYAFWRENWKWANVVVLPSPTGRPESYKIDVEALGLSIDLSVAKTSPTELSFTYEIMSTKTLNGVVGGGLEFVLDVDPKMLFSGKADEPEIPRKNRGWSWKTAWKPAPGS